MTCLHIHVVVLCISVPYTCSQLQFYQFLTSAHLCDLKSLECQFVAIYSSENIKVLAMLLSNRLKPWSHRPTRLNSMASRTVVTELASWVEMSRVGRCDYSKNSTGQKVDSLLSVVKFWTCWELHNWQKSVIFVQLSRGGRCDHDDLTRCCNHSALRTISFCISQRQPNCYYCARRKL